jgi:signal transduction histidine kinase
VRERFAYTCPFGPGRPRGDTLIITDIPRSDSEQMSNFSSKHSTDVSKHALVAELWSQRFRDPLALVSLALPIVAREDELRAFGYLQLAWGYRYQGENAKAADCLAHAQSLYFERHDEAGLANCRDLEATLLSARNHHAEALALLHVNLALPLEMRRPIERMITHDRCGYLHDLLGDRDESLRQRYAALDAARASDDPAAIAFALGMLGGVHADLYNLDDADQLCREGLSLIDPDTAMQAWSLVALNHMNALLAMDRSTEATNHADRLLKLETRLNQRAAEQRFIVYADAFASNGEVARAQSMLDHSTSLRSDKQQSLISFTSAQIRVWNAQRQPERARALAEAYLADPQNGSDPAQVPTELLRILQGAAAACEVLGDFSAALDYQKQAFAVHESLVGRSARARRLTLEIQHHLDRERWEREEAQRRQSDAEIEGRRLSALNDQLDAALQTRTRFLAAASHDLRQPAHALALYAQALEHETSRPALVDLSKRMRATVGSLSNMFDGLLELARLDAGAVKPQQDVFDLNELLARLCAEYADRLTHANALLKFRRTKIDCFIRSDVVLVERILRNLIGNAVKYAGEGNILVALRKRESMLAIEVRDAGPGMDAEEQRHIFDEFYRASSANERRDGLGLGLSIVERFARLLGVQVTVRSALGRGTTFSLALPITQLVSRPAKSMDIEARVVATVARRIAVIDDDPDARESMALVLMQWGHDCVAGGSADEVLAKARRAQWKPDALICDFQLRARNALADIAALRETFGAALPVLVVSGSHDAQATIIEHSPDAAYLAKPIRPLRLKSWLASIGKT